MRRTAGGATITPAAPAAIDASDNSRMAAKPGLETPTTTGTRPATRSSTRRTKLIDSLPDSFGASPMMPRMVRPVAPRSR